MTLGDKIQQVEDEILALMEDPSKRTLERYLRLKNQVESLELTFSLLGNVSDN